jgi:hypothetical protein
VAADLSGYLPRCLELDVRNHHGFGLLSREAAAQGPPDSICTAGYHHHFALELHSSIIQRSSRVSSPNPGLNALGSASV